MKYDCDDLFSEWDQLIEKISDDEYELLSLKYHRDEEEFKIINETDFKELYGANNDRVRKNHLRTVLKETYENINNLELNIANIKRRLSYIKSMIDYKMCMMAYEKGNAEN